jgi:hypothetical protein
LPEVTTVRVKARTTIHTSPRVAWRPGDEFDLAPDLAAEMAAAGAVEILASPEAESLPAAAPDGHE